MARKTPSKVRREQTRNIARDRERRRSQHYGEHIDTRCEGCGKVAAFSEKEAWALALHYYAHRGGERPRRVYPCSVVAGTWHWTRRA